MINSSQSQCHSSSGCGHQHVFDGASAAYKRALWLVIIINFVMFLVEFGMSFFADSQALRADALDFLMDTTTYSISLLVIGKAQSIRSKAALFKGFSLLVLAGIIFISTIMKWFQGHEPHAESMGIIGVIALFANLLSLIILVRFRDGDANVRSVWLCSRNDAIGNVLVISSAIAVATLNQNWPDLLAAFVLVSLFTRSASQIIHQAMTELKANAINDSAKPKSSIKRDDNKPPHSH